MTNAAVRHRGSNVAMRAQTARQNKAAIRMGEADDLMVVCNFTRPHIAVSVKTLNGVRRVRALADEFGATRVEINGVYGNSNIDVEVWFDD